ncbi:MAG: hypothetical protein R2875_04995 [Desulfobacterales bacterium]
MAVIVNRVHEAVSPGKQGDESGGNFENPMFDPALSDKLFRVCQNTRKMAP